MADKAITRRLKIYVNGEEVDATITNLRKNLAKFRSLANKQIEGTEKFKKYNAEVAKTEIELKQARDAQKQFRESAKLSAKGIDENSKAITEFSGNLTNMFRGLKYGDFLQFQEGFKGVKTGIQGATKAGLAFIATPIGAAITVLAGIGIAAKEWFDYNESIKESIILTEQITKLTGDQADAIRNRNTALSKTFNTDQQETLETAAALVTKFKVSYEEAFDAIEDGLVKGQDKNNEYFDSLSEYAVFLAEAGYSVTEFKDIVSTGYDLKFYKDKLPDAIKEATIEISTESENLKKELSSALGKEFTDSLFDNFADGSITIKDVLSEIDTEIQKQGVSRTELAKITERLFISAGEDGGGAIKIFEAMTKASEDANRALTPLEASTRELIETNKAFAKSQDEALKSDNFISFTRDLEIFWTKTKTLFYNGVTYVTDLWTRGNDFFISNFTATVLTAQQLPTILKNGLKDVATSVLNTIKTFGGLGDIITKLVSLDFSGAKAAAIDFKNNFSTAFEDVKNSAKGTVKEIINTQQATQQLVQAQLDAKRAGNVAAVKAEEEASVNTGGSGNVVSKTEANTKKLEEQKKEQEEELQRIKDFEAAKKALKEEIALENEESEKGKELLKLEQEFEQRESDFEKLRLDAEEETELLKLLEEAKNAELAKITDKYNKLDEKTRTAAAKKELQDRKNLNNSIINGAISLAGQQTRVGQALLAIKGVMAAKEMLIELGILKGKAAVSVAKSQIATAEGAAQTSKVGFPQNIPLLIAFAAQAVGIISAVKNAVGVSKKVKTPSFAAGGDTGFGNLGLGSNTGGYIRGVVEEGEYVIPKPVRQDPQVPRVIEFLEAKRTGQDIPNTPSPFQDNTALNNTLSLIAETVSRLSAQIDNGIVAETYYGLNNEIERKKIQEKLEQTLNASNN